MASAMAGRFVSLRRPERRPMSVRGWRPDGMGRRLAKIGALRPQVLVWARHDGVRIAPAAGLVASGAACAMNCGQETVIEGLDVPEAEVGPVEPGEAFREVSLVVHDCTSDRGRDLLPRQHGAVLKAARIRAPA